MNEEESDVLNLPSSIKETCILSRERNAPVHGLSGIL